MVSVVVVLEKINFVEVVVTNVKIVRVRVPGIVEVVVVVLVLIEAPLVIVVLLVKKRVTLIKSVTELKFVTLFIRVVVSVTTRREVRVTRDVT